MNNSVKLTQEQLAIMEDINTISIAAREVNDLSDDKFYEFFGNLAGINGMALSNHNDRIEFIDWIKEVLNEISDTNPEIAKMFKADDDGCQGNDTTWSDSLDIKICPMCGKKLKGD